MSDQLFQSNPQEQKPQETPEQQNPSNPDALFADQLQSIKNEQGAAKYASVDEALKALQHSQSYIPELKTELSAKDQRIADLEAELATNKSVQEALQGQTPPPAAEPQAPTYGEEDINKLITQRLESDKAQALAQANLKQVETHLTDNFGADAKAKIAERAVQLGMTVEEIGDWAMKSPNAVIQLFGGQAKPAGGVTGGHNIPRQTPQTELEKPTKSLLAGASAQEQAEYMRKIQAHVYNKHGITG